MKKGFEDVKVGDTVLIEESVSTGFSEYHYFWVPKTVVKVTPTQIVIETGDRYKKADGSIIGSKRDKWSSRRDGEEIAIPGSVVGPFNNVVVRDQTDEMRVFLERLLFHKNLVNRVKELQQITYDNNYLYEIGSLIREAYELFEREE